jgi:hypothetical protein
MRWISEHDEVEGSKKADEVVKEVVEKKNNLTKSLPLLLNEPLRLSISAVE